ncbi:hypothetical protein D3C86_2195180 [compost metagenome]
MVAWMVNHLSITRALPAKRVLNAASASAASAESGNRCARIVKAWLRSVMLLADLNASTARVGSFSA